MFAVCGSRIKRMIEEIGGIGRDKGGGNTRLAFTQEDARARNLFIRWLEDCELEVKVDAVGNIIGRYAGLDLTLPPLVMGSHLDTVPNGGLFDGVLGCVAALECVQVLYESNKRLQHPVEVIVFANEEGGRFGTGLLGSRAMIGSVPVEELKTSFDDQGYSVWEAMKDFGLRPDQLKDTLRTSKDMSAYLEIHIEQGAILATEKIAVGVVTGVVGIRRLNLLIEGEANHAGTTPFHLRRDALLAAARITDAVRVRTQQVGEKSTVATVGIIQGWPGAVNVVAGKARLSIEIRDVLEQVIERVEQAIKHSWEAIAEEEGVTVTVESADYVPPAPVSEDIRLVIEKSCQDLNISYKNMPSGAGHDAQSMAAICPMGLIFVPSQGGISHAPQEVSTWEDIETGVNVLLQSLIKLDRLYVKEDDITSHR